MALIASALAMLRVRSACRSDVYSILRPSDAARGVDLLYRELHAVIEVGARRGAGAGQLYQPEDLDRLALAKQWLRQRQAYEEGGNTCKGPHRTEKPPVSE